MTKFKTQDEVEKEIDRLIGIALQYEACRDASEYESAEYWKHHDNAIQYHEKARKLMPKGS